MTARAAYPPKPATAQLGAASKPGVCAYAWREGCGLETARFYISGWRCERHRP